MNYDAACFHTEQCAEKYLKARLQEEGFTFSKTHDLRMLLNLVLPFESNWDGMRPHLQALTAFAVDFRYPRAMADKAIAAEAIKLCCI